MLQSWLLGSPGWKRKTGRRCTAMRAGNSLRSPEGGSLWKPPGDGGCSLPSAVPGSHRCELIAHASFYRHEHGRPNIVLQASRGPARATFAHRFAFPDLIDGLCVRPESPGTALLSLALYRFSSCPVVAAAPGPFLPRATPQTRRPPAASPSPATSSSTSAAPNTPRRSPSKPASAAIVTFRRKIRGVSQVFSVSPVTGSCKNARIPIQSARCKAFLHGNVVFLLTQ